MLAGIIYSEGMEIFPHTQWEEYQYEMCIRDRSYLKPKRMPHVLGTEQEAVRLAERYGADVTKARIAALLHDLSLIHI